MTSGHKQVISGEFWERVGHRIFGGELCRNENGDLCDWDLETTFEVKGSSRQSSYGQRYNLNQLKLYNRRASGFPFSHAIYVNFCFDNKSVLHNGRRRPGFALHNEPKSAYRFLAKEALWGIAIDISIINRWAEIFPTSRKSILGHLGMPTVDLKCSKLHGYIHNDLCEHLAFLNLDPERYRVLIGGFKGRFRLGPLGRYSLDIPLTMVLEKAHARKVRDELFRRGIQVKLKHPAQLRKRTLVQVLLFCRPLGNFLVC